MSNADEPRSRIDQLIALADKLSQQEVPKEKTPGHRWLPIVLGLAGIAILIVGIMMATRDSGSSTDPTVPATVLTTPVDPGAPVAWAEYRDGKIYLRGRVPDQVTSDGIRDQVALAVGPENVVVEYVIDPSAPIVDGVPLYIRDVLFESGEVDINAQTKDILDLGVLLMSQNPQATIDIDSYTDATGTEESNLALSQSRIDAMLAYLVSKGADPMRLTSTAFGEANPVADNETEAGRAMNRRVDFTINNLFG